MEAVQARKQRMIAGALTDQEVRSARIEELKMLFTQVMKAGLFRTADKSRFGKFLDLDSPSSHTVLLCKESSTYRLYLNLLFKLDRLII